MRIYKGSSKTGARLLDAAFRCHARELREIYSTWSSVKQRAYDWCISEYVNSVDSTNFRIGNANTFGFTATWQCVVDGKLAQRIETKDNSYLVFLEF